MKIGILTFHRAHNYGAMLQAYALRHVLVNKGFNVEFISYRQDKIEEAYRAWQWHYDMKLGLAENLKNFISSCITLPRRHKRRKSFVRFAKAYLPETSSYYQQELQGVVLNYDAVFFGSDQIWTTRFMGQFDDVFWGGINLEHGKKIAYAPSMELKSVNNEEKRYIYDHIKNFNSISAREMHMSELIKSITGLDVPTVVDPTLLCCREDYSSLITSSTKVASEPYVLVYQVGHYTLVDAIAKKVAEQLDCKIIEIGSEVLLHNRSSYKDDYGPEDFVALIANAKFVVSCSFHGTAFSVNMQKPFYSILIEGLDSRAISFLTQVGLMQCGIRNIDDVNAKSLLELDFTESNKELKKMRKFSFDYINHSLK